MPLAVTDLPVSESWHVARTMRVLELLAFGPLSVLEVATAMGSEARTMRRTLARLADEEYVTREDGYRQRYLPTMRLVALAAQVLENSELVGRAQPYISLLRERTGATAHLVMPSYNSVVCVIHGSDETVEPARIREVIPAHCTAGGKVLLAWRDSWRDSLLARPLERVTDHTITDPLRLRDELRTVRDRGYAKEDGEYMQHSQAVAAPVITKGNEVVAAMTIDGCHLAEGAIDAVVRTAAELSSDLSRRR
jgi:DNA-binding IclR family transcriptional regulator